MIQQLSRRIFFISVVIVEQQEVITLHLAFIISVSKLWLTFKSKSSELSWISSSLFHDIVVVVFLKSYTEVKAWRLFWECCSLKLSCFAHSYTYKQQNYHEQTVTLYKAPIVSCDALVLLHCNFITTAISDKNSQILL